MFLRISSRFVDLYYLNVLESNIKTWTDAAVDNNNNFELLLGVDLVSGVAVDSFIRIDQYQLSVKFAANVKS